MKNWLRKIWDALVKLVAGIPCDKLLHFIGGLIIAAFFALVVPGFFAKWCIIPVIAAGFLKELFDKWTTGQFDWWDIVATIAGGLVIQLFVII